MRFIDKFIAFRKAAEARALVNEMIGGWKGARDLVDQAARAAGSVTFNLREGTTRPRDSADRLRYYRFAWGSAVELETILDSAAERHLGPPDSLARARSLTSEVARILTVSVHKQPAPHPGP
ncbi:MAG TPA: four helix bundle protein [Kofleriaceae bacterium]|nr:four helix bundle protein [Kofleriaceae bacterium]